MKLLKITTCLVLSLFLLFSIMLINIGMFIHYRICNFNYYISQYNNLNFYHSISVNSIKSISTLSRTTNIPMDVFMPFTEEKWIKAETDKYTKQLFLYILSQQDSLYVIDFSKPGQKFDENLNNYLKLNNAVLDKTSEDEIKVVKNEAIQMVNNNIIFFNLKGMISDENLIKARSIFRFFYSNTWTYLGIVSLLLIMILVFFRKRFITVITWYGYSFTASGMLIFLFFFIPYRMRIMLNISIWEDSKLKALIILLIEDTYQYFIGSGIVITMLSTFIITMAYVLHSVFSIENKVKQANL